MTLGFAPVAFAKQARDVQVEVWPVGKYPALAAWFGIEGRCDVRFAVDQDGYAFAVQPSCTHKIFCFDAKRAVSAAIFLPKLVDGVPTVQTNIVFPIDYYLENSTYEYENDHRPLKPCEELAVS